MRELSLSGGSWSKSARFLLLLAVAAVLLIPGYAAATEADVTKVLVADGEVREITNPGTVQAVNAILGSDDMPADAKVQAVTSALRGAALRGRLVPTSLAVDDTFVALDSKTGELIVVRYEGSDFALPSGSTGFTHLFIPIG